MKGVENRVQALEVEVEALRGRVAWLESALTLLTEAMESATQGRQRLPAVNLWELGRMARELRQEMKDS
jgi:exonuclease VII small subunit